MRTKFALSYRRIAVVAAAFALASGCAGKKPPKPMTPATNETEMDAGAEDADAGPPPAPKSLYDRMGGKAGVTAILDSFMKNAAADADIKKYFAKTTGPKLDHFKQQMHDFLCEKTGGGCKYEGKEMKPAHKGMGITENAWEAFVKDFTLALDENKVGETEKNEIFAVIAPLHDEIVEKKSKR